MIRLRCPRCRQIIKNFFSLGDFQILKCSCSEYPVYKDIIYLIDNDIRKKSVELIRTNHKILAIKSFLNLPYRVFIPLYLLTQTGIAKILGFENTIKIIKLFGYNADWSHYLLRRKEIPYYQISLASLNLVNQKKSTVLDIGCGVGHFFPEIINKLNPNNIVGIDISFLNLYLAKYFIDNKKLSLICSDVEKSLVFNNRQFDFIHMADTFQYVKNKKLLLTELSRVIKPRGIIVVPHTHEKNIENIKGTSQTLTKDCLTASGFKNVNIVTDNNLLSSLDLGNLAQLTSSDAYSIFASKSFTFKHTILKDKEYIFVSPHLDDAVLSTTFLIKKLKMANLNVNVITVFTKGDNKPYTPQAKNFLKLSEFNNPKDLFNEFKQEDSKTMKKLGVDFTNLGFIDAAFRKDAFRKNIYESSEAQFSGVILEPDKTLIRQIADKIKKHIGNLNDVIFISPLGIGGHADHVITREAIKLLDRPTVYYEEYPYNRHSNNIKSFFSKNKHYKFIFQITNDKAFLKQDLIKIYKSQMFGLFPNKEIDGLDENYYVLQA